jgi:uncharacterized membrane protein
MPEPAVRPSKDRGQVVPLMAGVLVVVALLAVGVAHVGSQAAGRARVQNAADAAALAAALQLDPADAEQIAGLLAGRNGAELVEVHRVDAVTVVHVRLGDHEAAAAARPVAGPNEAGLYEASP